MSTPRNLPEADRPPPSRREVDGYFEGSDPYQGISNPDAFSNWSPDKQTTNIPSDWKDNKALRTYAADKNYGRNGITPQTTPGVHDLPTGGSPSGGPGGSNGYSTNSMAQANWDRELLWRTEDRALDERLRAEAEAKEKEDRLKRSAAYDAYDTQMRDVYSSQRVNSRFDPMVTAAGGAYDSGAQRLAGITADMTSRGAESRTAVADAFSAGDQRLQDLRAQYGQQQANTDGMFNSILSGYGAGGVEQGSGYNDRLFANAQAGNARAGTIFDASAADRGALVGGLQGDVSTGMTQRKTAMLAQIAAQRLAAQQQSDSSLAQALAQSGIARGNL